MRQTKRGLVAMAMVMTIWVALPSRGHAAAGGRGSAWEGERVTTDVAWRGWGGARSGFGEWLRGLVTAFWGEVRSVIVPGDDIGATQHLTTETDFTGGGD